MLGSLCKGAPPLVVGLVLLAAAGGASAQRVGFQPFTGACFDAGCDPGLWTTDALAGHSFSRTLHKGNKLTLAGDHRHAARGKHKAQGRAATSAAEFDFNDELPGLPVNLGRAPYPFDGQSLFGEESAGVAGDRNKDGPEANPAGLGERIAATASSVPEPTSLTLLGSGLLGMVAAIRRRRRPSA